RPAGADIEANPHGALMEVRLAVGLVGGAAHHGHHRETPEDDDANVGKPLEAVLEHVRAAADQGLDDGGVGPAAEAVDAAQDVGDVVADVLQAHGLVARLQEKLAVPAGDHDYPFAA